MKSIVSIPGLKLRGICVLGRDQKFRNIGSGAKYPCWPQAFPVHDY